MIRVDSSLTDRTWSDVNRRQQTTKVACLGLTTHFKDFQIECLVYPCRGTCTLSVDGIGHMISEGCEPTLTA